MELDELGKYVKNATKNDKDIFKCIISLNIDDALALGYDKRDKWKELIDSKIDEMIEYLNPPIKRENLEYVAAFHVKDPNMHCHLTFWDKNQKDFSKKPFMNYEKIRKVFSEEVYRDVLYEKLYPKEDKLEKEFKSMSKNMLDKYKDEFKEKINFKGEIDFKPVDISKEEKFINDIIKKMKLFDKAYIYDENDPTKFTEITKETLTKIKKDDSNLSPEELEKKYDTYLSYKNNGEDGIFYNENTISDTACFLKNLNNLKVVYSEEEFKNVLDEFKENESKVLDYIKETRPELLPNKFFSNKFVESFMPDIANEIYNLKNTLEKQFKEEDKKMTFRYGYLSSEMKLQIDKLSNLIINTSKDCKNEFNEYVKNFKEAEKLKGEFVLSKPKDLIRVQTAAQDEMYKIMGNQILQFMKENIKEVKEENKQKFEDKAQVQKLVKNINQNIRNQKQEEYEAKNLIKALAETMSHANTSMNGKISSLSKQASFSNMTKEEIKAKIQEKKNSSGFDWGV